MNELGDKLNKLYGEDKKTTIWVRLKRVPVWVYNQVKAFMRLLLTLCKKMVSITIFKKKQTSPDK